jgi:aminoglycoside phosphotransferase (APT) family kinase protein
VAAVGPSGGPPRAVIKLATTLPAAASLGREREVLTALRADARLGTFRRLLPTVLADGQLNGYHYAVEGFCPGTVASGLLDQAPALNAFQAAAASEVAVLHSATAAQMTVDASVLARWVDQPIRTLRHLKPQATWAAALDRISGELGATLAGRTLQVGWIHGDFAPSNILVTPDASAVVGIVDWELAASPDLPSIDVTTLLLTTRAAAEHQELGHVVRALLTQRRWTDREAAVADSVQPGLADDEEEIRATVLLSWLRHAAANLTKSVRYGHHRIWIVNNVDVVLDTLRWS